MEMKGPELSMSLTESYSRVRRGLTEESKLRTVGSGRAWKVEEEADWIVVGEKEDVGVAIEEGEDVEEKEGVRGEGDGHERHVGDELVDVDESPERLKRGLAN